MNEEIKKKAKNVYIVEIMRDITKKGYIVLKA